MYVANFNSYTIQNDTNTTVEILEGISRVEDRISKDFLTGLDGGNIWERKRGMRIITIRGTLFADDFTTYYTLRNAMERAFTIDVDALPLTITRSDGTQRLINAKVTDMPQFTEKAGEFAECSYEIVLTGEDPFYQDTSLISGTIVPGSTGGTPVPSPVASPLGGTQQHLYFVNDGDVADYPTFLITGNITNASIRNNTTGKQFNITQAIPNGHFVYIYVDTTGEYVMYDSLTNWYQYLSGDIFQIIVGSNDIVFNGSSFDSSASLTMTFRKKYKTL